MNIEKLIKEYLYLDYDDMKIMSLSVKENNINVRFSYLSRPYKYLTFKNCLFEVIKKKTFFGEKVKLNLISIS